MLGVLGFLFQDLKVLVCSFKVAGFRASQFSDSGFLGRNTAKKHSNAQAMDARMLGTG